jgi:arabinose-5-phosphate isomerase
MRRGNDMPCVKNGVPAMQAVVEMSRSRMGMTAVVDEAGRVRGIFTDGDLRRSLEKGADFHATAVDSLMTTGPKTIRAEALAVEAVQLMERHKVNQLLVVDERERLVGALNMHDLFRAKVI